MWPKSFWMKYEHFIRRMAGLGKCPTEPDPDRYDKLYAHCDVLVVGGGPAGLAAALAAGRAGARVILADEQQEIGGSLLSDRQAMIDGKPAADWVADALAELRAMPDVTLLPRTIVFGYHDHNMVSLMERVTDHLIRPRPKRCASRASACGACAPRTWSWRPARSSGRWSSPTTTGRAACWPPPRRPTSTATAPRPASAPCVFTNNDSAYRAALDLVDAGVSVAAIVDRARRIPTASWSASARSRGIEILAGHAITRVKGKLAVREVEVRRLTGDGKGVTSDARQLDCDLVMMSGGWKPTVHLFSQSRGKLRMERRTSWPSCPDKLLPGQNNQSVGAARGRFALADCLVDGHAAGAAAAARRRLHAARRQHAGRRRGAERSARCARCGSCRRASRSATSGKHFVDYQNDVTAADVALAHREGYRSVEHLKRYTTMGMATDQGKTSNVNALAILAELRGISVPEVGTTTFRPPYTPVTIGAFSGIDKGDFLDPDPQDAAAFLARAARRAVRERRPVAPRLVLSEARREHARRGQPRGQGGAHLGRHRRCLDAGQDRHPGTRRRLVPQQGLHQRLVQAGARHAAATA